MESALCKKAVEYIPESQISINDYGISSVLSYTQINEEIMQNPLKNKDIAMCIISNLVYYYDDSDKLNNSIKKWGIEYKIKILDRLVYIVFYSKNYIFIVFKGTTKFNEVLSDIDFVQIDDLYNIPGKIHRGFHNIILKNNVIESIKEDVENIVSSIGTEDIQVPIIITGHSLGAALATIFYAYLSSNCKDDKCLSNIELVTFGSPRVGDDEFTKNLKSTRFVHGNDIITKLPIFKYKHTEKLIRLGNTYSCKFFTDHFLEGYYTELMKKSSFI